MILDVLSFLVILSILVLVHELGHFIMARKLGIKVEEFGIGYPPRVLSKKIKGIVYSLNLLPLGGFVRLLGEDYLSEEKMKKGETEKAFFNKPKWVRTAVLMAGVVMNFLLGVFLFGLVYTKIGIPEQVDYLLVSGLSEGGPAQEAGLKLDDQIVGVKGYKGDNFTKDFVGFVKDRAGEEVVLILSTGEKIEVTPREESEVPEGEGALGVIITNVDLIQYPMWQRPFRGAVVGLKEAWGWGKDIVLGVISIFSRLVTGQVPEDIAGPVGIFQISQSVVKEGLITTLQFMGILSINLAILNLLPIPALDGGRLLFVAVEAVTRKRLNPKTEQLIHLVGMAFLLGLMVLVTIGDVRRIVGS